MPREEHFYERARALPGHCDWLRARGYTALPGFGGGWAPDGVGGAKPYRRNLHQRGLYAYEDDGGERTRGVSCASRQRLRCADRRHSHRYGAGATAEARHCG